MRLTVTTSVLIPRAARRHFFTLAKVPIRVWQTQSRTKKIVEEQTGPGSKTKAGRTPNGTDSVFHDGIAFALKHEFVGYASLLGAMQVCRAQERRQREGTS